MPDRSRYRWTRAYGLRFLGTSTAVLAVLWVVAAFSGFDWWALVLLAIGAVAVVGCLIRLVWVPPLLLEITSHGYRLANVRGGGVSEATWGEVEAVTSGSSPGGPVMEVRLRDGRSTVVPLTLLGSQALTAEREMHTRLNAAFGYRRLHGA